MINNEEKLLELIRYYEPAGLQLHFESNAQLVKSLRSRFPSLLVLGVLTDESSEPDYSLLNQLHDYIIYDSSYQGGTNKPNKYKWYELFPIELKRKTLFAGGINSERAEELIVKESAGFDIQSFFRSAGSMSYRNLDKICDLLKFPRKNKLSVSLTDIPLMQMPQSLFYNYYDHLEYHLDVSDGTLYPEFNTICSSIIEKQYFLKELPYSIHFFMLDNTCLKENIEKTIARYPCNLTRIFVQYFGSIDNKILYNSEINVIPSVFYKDLPSFISHFYDAEFISIVVPQPDKIESIQWFIEMFNSNKSFFDGKEIWLDRNLDLEYIKLLRHNLDCHFNVIVGKTIGGEWNQINTIHESVLK